MRIDKKYILLAALLISLILFEFFAPKDPDWSYSFSKDDKAPFGAYITYDLLEDIFPDKEIASNELSLYNFTKPSKTNNYSYIISTSNFTIDKVNQNQLLSMANNGANIFISAMQFEESLGDTLGFSTEKFFSNTFSADSIPIRFKNPYLKSKNGYFIQKSVVNYYFSEFDTTTTMVLGTFGEENVNFIRVFFGNGTFYLHTQPIAFTNYNMLSKNNAEYVFKAFSYVNSDFIVWDEKYKPKRANAGSPLSYILKQNALRSAYYLILGLIVLFFFFNGKRKQRAIKIINPLSNSSLEFASTLGNLYLNNKNHKDILLKRYLYWIGFLREKYYLSVEKLGEKTPELIAEKTGVEIDCVSKILGLYKRANQQKTTSAEQLLAFNKQIEKFYKNRL